MGKPTTPKMNDTQAIILGVLHMEQMHGGSIMREIEKMSPFFSVTRSQVYRELPTLEFWGYTRLGKPGPRGAQTYSITPKGKKAFQSWLTEAPDRAILRQPFVVRVWFSWLQKVDGQLDGLIAAASEYHAAELKAAEEMQDRAIQEDDQGAVSAYGFCIMYHSMILGWLRETVL